MHACYLVRIQPHAEQVVVIERAIADRVLPYIDWMARSLGKDRRIAVLVLRFVKRLNALVQFHGKRRSSIRIGHDLNVNSGVRESSRFQGLI